MAMCFNKTSKEKLGFYHLPFSIESILSSVFPVGRGSVRANLERTARRPNWGIYAGDTPHLQSVALK